MEEMNQKREALARPATVAVMHFFSERTDGVSLQIHENDRVLAEQGWRVIECSADARDKDGFLLPELDYSLPTVQMFKRRDPAEAQDENAMESAFEEQVQVIKRKLGELIRQYQPQVMHIRNMLSLPIHPVATVAMAEFMTEHPEIGFLTQHHDFSFEDEFVPGDRKKAYEVPYPGIQKRIEEALLYTTPRVHHAVINSLMQKTLLDRFGLHAAVIPDAFDFSIQPRKIPNLRKRLGIREQDFVVGAMARIIPRKAMEVAVQFIATLRERRSDFLGEGRGIHRRTITGDSRFLLLLPQAAGLDEPRNAAYFKKLRQFAGAQGVEIFYIGDQVVADSAYGGEADKIPFYSLYNAVDLQMFPSYQEGFGNQFLEAVALGDGVVCAHVYPVMEADILPRISPEGIISLGTNQEYTLDEMGLVHLREDILQAAVEHEIHFLLHPDEEQRVATTTRSRLLAAFDAAVVGHHLSELLTRAARA